MAGLADIGGKLDLGTEMGHRREAWLAQYRDMAAVRVTIEDSKSQEQQREHCHVVSVSLKSSRRPAGVANSMKPTKCCWLTSHGN